MHVAWSLCCLARSPGFKLKPHTSAGLKYLIYKSEQPSCLNKTSSHLSLLASVNGWVNKDQKNWTYRTFTSRLKRSKEHEIYLQALTFLKLETL